MVASVQIKVNMARASRFLTNVQRKQIPFATAQAITRTLHITKADELIQLERDLDRPTPWTKRGFRVEGAKKTTLTGRLYILPSQLKYMQYQISGGVRRARGTALALPPAKSMPGDIPRNKYGNISRTKHARALLAKGAFSATINGVAGIWMAPKKTKTGKVRKGSRMKLLLAYERQATYRPRFHFLRRGRKSIDQNWTNQFHHSFKSAMRSAR